MKKILLFLAIIVVLLFFYLYESKINKTENDLGSSALSVVVPDGFGPPSIALVDATETKKCEGSLASYDDGFADASLDDIEKILKELDCEIFSSDVLYKEVPHYNFFDTENGYVIDEQNNKFGRILFAKRVQTGNDLNEMNGPSEKKFTYEELASITPDEQLVAVSQKADFFITQKCVPECGKFNLRNATASVLVEGVYTGLRYSTEGYTEVVYDSVHNGFVFVTKRTSTNESKYTYSYLSLAKMPYKVVDLGVFGPFDDAGGEGDMCLSRGSIQFEENSIIVSCNEVVKSFSVPSV